MKIATVTSARKDVRGTCLGCGKPITKGQSYSHFSPYRMSKRVRHVECGPFKQSELASNDKLSELYAAIEDAEANVASLGDEFLLEDAQQILDDCADTIDGVAEMYEESASNIEDGFGHSTSLSEEMSDNASLLQDFAQTVRDALSDLEESNEDQWRDEVIAAMEQALGECPL